MSDTDSFIEEVTEEVRRDRMFALLRKYGWIGVLVIVAVVGAAAYSEYTKSIARANAQAAGDAILAALDHDTPQERISALEKTELGTDGVQIVKDMLMSAEYVQEEDLKGAASALKDVQNATQAPEIYRDLAQFKALVLSAQDTDLEIRRAGLEGFNKAGNALRVLAQEQLALMDLQTGDSTAAIEKFQNIMEDSESSRSQKERAFQMLLALGAEPDFSQILQSQLTQGEN